MARWWRAAADNVRLKVSHGSTHTHHIHQSIDGADFMEMHGVSLTAMNCGLGFGKSAEHLQHLRLQVRIQ
jgi:hypothetical protein